MPPSAWKKKTNTNHILGRFLPHDYLLPHPIFLFCATPPIKELMSSLQKRYEVYVWVCVRVCVWCVCAVCICMHTVHLGLCVCVSFLHSKRCVDETENHSQSSILWSPLSCFFDERISSLSLIHSTLTNGSLLLSLSGEKRQSVLHAEYASVFQPYWIRENIIFYAHVSVFKTFLW